MTTMTLREAMLANETVSLRKLAITTEATYNVLLKASKAPISGVPYDPTSINYEEVEKKLVAKIGQEKFDAIDWKALSESVTAVSNLKDPVEVGDRVILRDRQAFYAVVYKTASHVVIQAEGTDAPRAMSNGTFEHLGGHKATEKDTLVKEVEVAAK